ncbi:hypothetical protein [Azorhizobium doebereinerae]|uniref:hypothetical protein n=1 Tax=Azorhizobium doebereinerae TaxID=281091 RepID=UPI00040B6A01|nr:hypothetical protein [Azorhizobium doebereinerae]
MDKMKWALPLLAVAILAAGAGPAPAQMRKEVGPQNAYVPSLGDIMGATQLRHFKLWFAGRLKNWDLAQYELDQIRASFQDAVTLYPGIPVTDMTVVAAPVHALEAAIAGKDEAAFAKSFNELTTACNSCHQMNDRGYIVIQVPTSSPFSNQVFEPLGRK